ncbi:MAG: hypothetical protein KKA19_02960, partial [Candidatus Margulisbacteria bacterium]|nr:hypothetical protein [Candidatus Margulisiibacteriota bacterium]
AYQQWQQGQFFMGAEVHEQCLSQDGKNLYLVFCFLPEQENEVREKLSSHNFVEVFIPQTKIPFSVQLVKLQKELKRIEEKINVFKEKLKKFFITEKEVLATWADYLKNEEKVTLWSTNLMKTKKVALIEGWIMRTRFAELQDALKQFAQEVEITEAPHSEGDEPPVVLDNSIISPFEAVTTVYGMPNNSEFDPTPLLAIFFALFFGICLSDFGYGLLLVLLSRSLLAKYKQQLTRYGKQLLTLTSYCGFSTMFIGILTGSYFGINLDKLAFTPLKSFLLSLKITDPMVSPLPLLIFSFILGIIQIYTGLWIRFLIDLRQKGRKEAFLQSGIWVYFVTGLIGWGVFFKVTQLALLFKTISLTGMIGLIITQGRHHQNPIMRLGSGLLSLYRLSGFVGDILSYSRLFALGLVTSVLSVVINLLASMTGGIPFIGGIIMVLLLVGGHIFNFLINILGAFVHSARLQYVEYFSKFFEGGGRFFKPFTWRTRYIKIEK